MREIQKCSIVKALGEYLVKCGSAVKTKHTEDQQSKKDRYGRKS